MQPPPHPAFAVSVALPISSFTHLSHISTSSCPHRRRRRRHRRRRPCRLPTVQATLHDAHSDSVVSTTETSTTGLAMTASRTQSAVTDPHDDQPLLHVVFVHPQIHWNTGNIGRTCLGLGARLHLISPLGFSLDAKQIRRAGLDYWEHVDVVVHESWDIFAKQVLPQIGGQRFFFSKFGTICATDIEWPVDEKAVLIFGSETAGFDGIREWLDTNGAEETVVAFPMVDDRFRSFNLSTSASMALWDAYKTVRRAIKP